LANGIAFGGPRDPDIARVSGVDFSRQCSAKSGLAVSHSPVVSRCRDIWICRYEKTSSLGIGARKREWGITRCFLDGHAHSSSQSAFLVHSIESDVRQVLRSFTHPGQEEGRNRDLIFYLIDIDHFKQVNDRYGHQVGDNVLVEIARGINSAARLSDQNGMAAVGGGAPTRLKRL
jgi:hypothetical protein